MPKKEKKKIDPISLRLAALQSQMELFKDTFKRADDMQAEFNDITNQRLDDVTTYILKIRETLRQMNDILSTQKENMTPKHKNKIKKIVKREMSNSNDVLNALTGGSMVHNAMYNDDQQFMEEQYMAIERRIRP